MPENVYLQQPENNVVYAHAVPVIDGIAADYLLAQPARFDPRILEYNRSTGEILGARTKKVETILEDRTRVVADFTEHGGQLKSLRHYIPNDDGETYTEVEVFTQGTFATYRDNGRQRVENVARGHEPLCIPQIGHDPQGEFRMHGELETSLMTFEAGLSDLGNGLVVFSIKGEELQGNTKYPNSVIFVAHQLEADGSITTSITLYNDGNQTMDLAPGFHPYFNRGYINEQNVAEDRALGAVSINGMTLEARNGCVMVDAPVGQVLLRDAEGKIIGVDFVFDDDDRREFLLVPLTGFTGRDAEVWAWTDNITKFMCVELTWGGDTTRGMRGRDGLDVPQGAVKVFAINRKVNVYPQAA